MSILTADLPLLTKEAYAIQHNVSAASVSRWLNEGKIQGVQVGSRVLIPSGTLKPGRKTYVHSGKYRKKPITLKTADQ